LNSANIAARTAFCQSAFDAMCPGIRTVRNVLAHQENYVLGRVNAQGSGGEVTQYLDWSIVVTLAPGEKMVFLIGGLRVDVLASAKAARKLADGVIASLGGPLTVSEVSACIRAVRTSELHFAMVRKLGPVRVRRGT
jgi:hypothetical protein